MANNQILIFNNTIIGASHINDAKPCQDYSLTWQSDDEMTSIVIVCDGHGSDTYVRSDVGSRLAAQVAVESIKTIVFGNVAHGYSANPEWILNKKGKVTAREQDEKLRYRSQRDKLESQLTEVEKQRYEQRLSFIKQTQGIHDQDAVFEALFNSIYEKWQDAIQLDSKENPFTDKELSKLADNKLEKAYGTTLMAYVQTPLYWFAFHIGDGRILACDREINWEQLVPWDCSCFQNHTTSLCNTNPVPLFRYAFDATGDFPAAVFCCSDGIEDSLGDYDVAPERMHDYYSSLLRVFVDEGKENTLSQLEEFLPKMSAKGSKDDMSLAGIINMDFVEEGIFKNKITLKQNELKEKKVLRNASRATLLTEIQEKESELGSLRERLEALTKANVVADSSDEAEIEKLEEEKVALSQCISRKKKSFLDGWKAKNAELLNK